jgi:hypothetical protein
MSEPELPIPDWDGLPFGELASHVRSLGADDLQALLAHEKEHADRVQVVQVLERRIDEVAQGAPLSDGDPTARRPGSATAPASRDNASPVTEGPPINPPSQGDPTNPAQPRG